MLRSSPRGRGWTIAASTAGACLAVLTAAAVIAPADGTTEAVPSSSSQRAPVGAGLAPSGTAAAAAASGGEVSGARVPRWLAASSAVATTASTDRGVLVAPRQVDATAQGAAGDGRTDDTAALQRALDGLRTGQALVLPAGRVFAHSGLLHLRRSGTALIGGGTLLATTPSSSALWVEASDTEVSGITVELRGATQRLGTWDDVGVRVAGTQRTSLRGITVRGSASAGIMVDGASGFILSDVVVEDTLADGIHITDGSHDGRVIGATTRRTGDDGVAVVSYRNEVPVSDVEVRSPRVEGTTWGRGLSVVGGQRIRFTDVAVSDTSAAAVYIAAEKGWNTWAARDVSVVGGTLTGSNQDPALDHGAVLVYNGDPSQVVSGVTISDLAISRTAAHASREVGVLADDGGSVSSVLLSDIAIDDPSRAAFSSNTPRAGFRLQGWTVAGRTVPDRSS